MATRTPREHALMIAAMFVLGGMGWFVFRFTPARRELAALASRTDELRTNLAARKMPAPPERLPARIRPELDAARAERAALETRVAELEAGFPPATGESDSGEVRLRISQLAERSGVTIETFGPVAASRLIGEANRARPTTPRPNAAPRAAATRGNPPTPTEPQPGVDAPPASLLEGVCGGAPYARPAHELELRGSFGSIGRFVEALGQLPWRVVILRFDVEAPDAKRDRDGDAARGLTARLVVTL